MAAAEETRNLWDVGGQEVVAIFPDHARAGEYDNDDADHSDPAEAINDAGDDGSGERT